MSYWVGLSDSDTKKYLDEFKKPSVTDSEFHPYKAEHCHDKTCDQIVIMRLINDPLSNSSYWVYAGKCAKGHWSQDLPMTPSDIKAPPRCGRCNSTMQWLMSQEFNGWVCVQNHEESSHE